MGTPESRWELCPLRSLLLACLVVSAAPCRGAALTPNEPPKTPSQEAPPAWEDKLREQLKKPVTIELKDATLADACETLSKHAGVLILIDPELRYKSRTITLPKIEMSAEHWLLWICRLTRCSYVLRDAAVLIVRPRPPGKPEKRDYDISDLLRSPSGKERAESIDEATMDGWCRYIRAVVAPETWDEDTLQQGYYQVFSRNGRLVVVNSEAVQKEVAALLDAHRKMRSVQVHILARFMTVDRAVLDGLKLEWLPREAGRAAAAASLPEDKAKALLGAIVKEHKGAVLSAPRVTCFNGQRASLRTTVNHSYVRTIPKEPEPEIGGAPENKGVTVQPFLSPDRKTLTLVVGEARRELFGVPAGFVGVAGPPPFDAVVTLPDGGSVLFSQSLPRAAGGKLAANWDQTMEVMLLTAEVVPDIFEE